jgi:hypothetical protein
MAIFTDNDTCRCPAWPGVEKTMHTYLISNAQDLIQPRCSYSDVSFPSANQTLLVGLDPGNGRIFDRGAFPGCEQFSPGDRGLKGLVSPSRQDIRIGT